MIINKMNIPSSLSSLAIILLLSVNMSNAQSKMILPSLASDKIVSTKGSSIQKTPSSGTLMPSFIKEDWDVVIKNYSPVSHGSPIPKEEYNLLKKEANAKRTAKNFNIPPSVRSSVDSVAAPKIHNNFKGNIRDNGIPMDNAIAVSRNGFVVSAINSNIIFAQPNGDITFTKGFPDFFKLLSLGTRMFDPRVIYDPVANKFIVVCLHGSESGNNYVCIAFSRTEDPNGEWSYYKIKGDVNDDGVWFDYPNVALSSNDLYIMGNSFADSGGWRYSVLMQIDKESGYNGVDLLWKYYDEVVSTSGNRVFNPVPVIAGWSDLPDPGMYFVSNNFGGGTEININYTTGSLSEDPSLISLRTVAPRMNFPPDARQKESLTLLDTGGTRIRSALYTTGVIHFGVQVGTDGGDVGIYYGRINLEDLGVSAEVLTTSGRDYAYPSFTTFGHDESDSEILLNYVVSGPDIHAGQAQRVVSGVGSTFNWSEETVLKEGVSIIGTNSDESTRWGDYTEASRRFFDGRVESWVTGAYGESRSYGTWLGQLVNEEEFNSRPWGEFIADRTTTQKDSVITFTDITSQDAIAWEWSFPNGVPDTSTEASPQVTYAADGAYNVSLIVTTPLGIDTIEKVEYIHIQDPTVKPIADFTLDKDTIFLGDSIYFTNATTDNAVNFKWTFQSGTPSSSTQKDPIITYNKKGSFLVSLTASNIAGTNTKIQQKAVTVLERIVLQSGFIADKTNISKGEVITFTDNTTGGPTAWEWTFEGGTPSTSTEQNPIVTYDTDGLYPVTLISSNEMGSDTITIDEYINVGQVATNDVRLIDNITIYPNPIAHGDKITLSFTTPKSQRLRFQLVDGMGRQVKVLYDDKVKLGKNSLSFNTSEISVGQYYVNIVQPTGAVSTIPFIVQ